MIKRGFDFIFGLTLLIILLPVMIIIALIIRLIMGSPVIFKQRRPGLNGKAFCLYKFRTMKVAPGNKLSECQADDEKRLTGLGRWLRKYSLDELPQLFNVVKGDISFVGPRPLLMEYLPRYSQEQARRHEVKPGITGWAQVNGRNAISWEEKFAFDVWYVDNQNIWLDFKILGMTLAKVLKTEGISLEGYSTMPEFLGNDQESNPEEEIKKNC